MLIARNIITIVALATAAVVAITAISLAQPTRTATTNSIAALSSAPYVSDKFSFQMNYPSGWQKVEASTEYPNAQGHAQIVTFIGPTDSGSEPKISVSIEDNYGISFSNFHFASGVKQAAYLMQDNYRVTNDTLMSPIGGRDAHRITWESNTNGLHRIIDQVFVDDVHDVYNLTFTAQGDNAIVYHDAFIAAAKSFHFLGNPLPINSIDGIECNPVEGLVYHIHSHLDVFIDGQRYQVPAGIGIQDNECFYWLHTHTTDGVIHVELPKPMNVTLGQFMDVWNMTKHDSVLPKALDSEPVSVYVNGIKVSTETSYRNIILHSREEIALIIGQKSPLAIPSTYPGSAPVA